VQAGLGLLHDLETVTRHARQTLGDPDIPGAAAPLAAPTLSLLEEKIHAQHADYLADRDSLLRVVDRAAVVRERVRRHGSQRETAGDARRPPGLRTE